YCDLGENQTGLKYLNEALLLCREIGDIRGIATVLSNLGGLYANLGEKQTAFNIFTEALSLFRTVSPNIA
ncbi:MAG TPA: tetratricopeptide repeat protein, partial [Acidobacteriota bacterium]|nr:tetratricopeptide repeat protein [Acidobacteriota bacterium]